MRIAVLVGVGLCLTQAVFARAEYAPRVGEVHPDFTLPHVDTRQPISLAQYRGKKILLVHFASW